MPGTWRLVLLTASVSAGLILLAAGCGQGPVGQGQAAPAPDAMAEAVEAMARRDYAAAAALLRRVVERSPERLEAHYRLGVSASYLDLTDEAVREFEWVVSHGRADSPEARLAREWLASRSRPAAAGATPQPAAASDPTRATLAGTVTWEENGVSQPKPWVRLFLKGVKGSPVENEFYRFQSGQDGTYRVTGVAPGDYSLTNRVAGPPIWRLRVTLKPGENAMLDLSPANSVTVRDDFPDSAG